MTFLTLRAFLPFVLVVFLVAGVTIHRRVLVPLIRVTVFAFDVGVFPAQRVTRFVVIELTRRILPVPLGMAVCAGRPQVSFVFVVFLVAGIAIRLRISILGFGFVTGLALDLLRVGMGALEREVRPFVIERQVRNRSDILRSSLVLRVTRLTVPLFFEPSVGALLLLDVLANVFVTILAERILRRLVEPLVTLCAVFFPFRMTFDHLPRHQRCLDVVRPGRCGHEHQRAEKKKGNVDS